MDQELLIFQINFITVVLQLQPLKHSALPPTFAKSEICQKDAKSSSISNNYLILIEYSWRNSFHAMWTWTPISLELPPKQEPDS